MLPNEIVGLIIGKKGEDAEPIYTTSLQGNAWACRGGLISVAALKQGVPLSNAAFDSRWETSASYYRYLPARA